MCRGERLLVPALASTFIAAFRVSFENFSTSRICEPVEIARAALFLASDDASFVNGETLYVDNGLMART